MYNGGGSGNGGPIRSLGSILYFSISLDKSMHNNGNKKQILKEITPTTICNADEIYTNPDVILESMVFS
jgi:hypothetical protein